MPIDPTKEVKVTLDSGKVLTFPPGMPIDQMRAAVQRANRLPPDLPGMSQGDPRSPRVAIPTAPAGDDPTAGGPIAAVTRGLAAGLGFVPGIGAGATALRVGGPIVATAAADALEGKNPMDNLTGWNTGMGVGGELLARGIPYATTALALGSGGAIGKMSMKDMTRAVAAHVRQGNRVSVPKLVGQDLNRPSLAGRAWNKVADAADSVPHMPKLPRAQAPMDFARSNIEATEKASRATMNLRDMEIHTPPGETRLPISRAGSVAKFNEGTLAEQAMKYHGITPKQWGALSAADQAAAVDMVNMPTRQVGELQRGASREAKNAIIGSVEGQPVYASPENAQLNKQFMDTLRQWRHGVGDTFGAVPQNSIQRALGNLPKPGEEGAIKAADALFSDYATLQSANEAMNAPHAIASTGALGGRAFIGGLGYQALGVPSPAAQALGVLTLSPKAISGAGWAASKAARYAPAAVRAEEATKKRTKRRDPK